MVVSFDCPSNNVKAALWIALQFYLPPTHPIPVSWPVTYCRWNGAKFRPWRDTCWYANYATVWKCLASYMMAKDNPGLISSHQDNATLIPPPLHSTRGYLVARQNWLWATLMVRGQGRDNAQTRWRSTLNHVFPPINSLCVLSSSL